jgi:hypothetical protein
LPVRELMNAQDPTGVSRIEEAQNGSASARRMGAA